VSKAKRILIPIFIVFTLAAIGVNIYFNFFEHRRVEKAAPAKIITPKEPPAAK
jgi:flagellar basal body-associated protein FliL